MEKKLHPAASLERHPVAIGGANFPRKPCELYSL